MHLNIHSLKNKMDRLEAYLEKEDPNIVCLTEHHLNEQVRRIVNFENFYEGSIFLQRQEG